MPIQFHDTIAAQLDHTIVRPQVFTAFALVLFKNVRTIILE
jgi:hypothetical protein